MIIERVPKRRNQLKNGELCLSFCKESKQRVNHKKVFNTYWEKNKAKCAIPFKMWKSGCFHRPFLAVQYQFQNFLLVQYGVIMCYHIDVSL